MRSITYLDSKNNPVHKQWSSDYAGVVVLHLAENNLYIERTADIFKFLCDVRYGHINKGFIKKFPVNFKKKPEIFMAKIDGVSIDLKTLFKSVLNHYQNTFLESHIRTSDYHGEELTATDLQNFSMNSNYPEDFMSIWKTDKENESDDKFRKQQEILATEEKRKKQREQDKLVMKKESELIKKFQKEMHAFKKQNGMPIPKKDKAQGDKLLWKMYK
jgi:DNA mismatch repair ATPase MutL|tara:strand:+ start:1018 stop:1665 length:648 start_codon:yes stop_codon:yes gene_type:complete